MNCIISCEHAVNTIPPLYEPLFAAHKDALESHRGFDVGALELAKNLASTLDCPLVTAKVSRLLIDCNRSLLHNACFSEFTKGLPIIEKQRIIEEYYQPYRHAVMKELAILLSLNEPVLHLSIHSFVRELHGVVRQADIGLLYDSGSEAEKLFSKALRNEMRSICPSYRIRMNYPYRGSSDGFACYLRHYFAASKYIGIEVEVNEALVRNPEEYLKMMHCLITSLKSIIITNGGRPGFDVGGKT